MALHFVAFRNLGRAGLQRDQIKAFAAQSTVTDGPNDEGEMFDRPGLPSDRFNGPYAERAGGGGR